ncbi:E3 ubiquitin-protein ligase SH3RF1-like [Anneissia japonica]|uniref:E3 ubiquitin-protein ligase SH3RF1-like n=1 Tax=Anneissia japonica TaxID=1529436 RepID=UPI001425A856|nr:E3 ubiquitin-protein ligase SH3RF1-like [Anneissia japonica]
MDEQALFRLLECSVCLERLDATSKVLPCQHTFCRRCLEGIVNLQNELRCPECRDVVHCSVAELPTNILLVRLLDGIVSSNSNQSTDRTFGRLSPMTTKTTNESSRNRSTSKNSTTPQPCAEALFKYDAQEPCDLSFNKGDMVILRKRIDENWYLGELNGKVGFFPAAYVKVVNPLPKAPPQCKALYSFDVKEKDDKDCLSFVKDEILNVIRRVDDNWVEGKKGDKIGIFPISFVEMNSTAKSLIGQTWTRKSTPDSGSGNVASNGNGSVQNGGATASQEVTRRREKTQKRHSFGAILSSQNKSHRDNHHRHSMEIGSPVLLSSSNPAAATLIDPWALAQSSGAQAASLPTAAASSRKPQALPANSAIPVSMVTMMHTPNSPTLMTAGTATAAAALNGNWQLTDQHAPVAKPQVEVYTAVFSYKPQNPDELELRKGEFYMVNEKCRDGWYKGLSIKTGQMGVFPGNYVQMYRYDKPRRSSSSTASEISSNLPNPIPVTMATVTTSSTTSGVTSIAQSQLVSCVNNQSGANLHIRNTGVSSTACQTIPISQPSKTSIQGTSGVTSGSPNTYPVLETRIQSLPSHDASKMADMHCNAGQKQISHTERAPHKQSTPMNIPTQVAKQTVNNSPRNSPPGYHGARVAVSSTSTNRVVAGTQTMATQTSTQKIPVRTQQPVRPKHPSVAFRHGSASPPNVPMHPSQNSRSTQGPYQQQALPSSVPVSPSHCHGNGNANASTQSVGTNGKMRAHNKVVRVNSQTQTSTTKVPNSCVNRVQTVHRTVSTPEPVKEPRSSSPGGSPMRRRSTSAGADDRQMLILEGASSNLPKSVATQFDGPHTPHSTKEPQHSTAVNDYIVNLSLQKNRRHSEGEQDKRLAVHKPSHTPPPASSPPGSPPPAYSAIPMHGTFVPKPVYQTGPDGLLAVMDPPITPPNRTVPDYDVFFPSTTAGGSPKNEKKERKEKERSTSFMRKLRKRSKSPPDDHSHARSSSLPIDEQAPHVGERKSKSADSTGRTESENAASNSADRREKPSKTPQLARAMYKVVVPYPANSDAELSLKIGDVVFVHKKRDDGWFKGTLKSSGRSGLFPGSFVELCSLQA